MTDTSTRVPGRFGQSLSIGLSVACGYVGMIIGVGYLTGRLSENTLLDLIEIVALPLLQALAVSLAFTFWPKRPST